MMFSILFNVGTDTEHSLQISDFVMPVTIHSTADAILLGVLLMSSTHSSTLRHILLHAILCSFVMSKEFKMRFMTSTGRVVPLSSFVVSRTSRNISDVRLMSFD